MNGAYVVTGASSGIGEAVARRLLARGEDVLMVARRADRLAAVQGEFPRARFFVCDLTEPESVARVAAAVKASVGPLAGFVHCAGFDAPAPLALVDDATAHALYAVHAVFPMRFLGWMGKAPNHGEGASVVLVSSVACHEGYPGGAAYAAAKGAVEGLYASAKPELATRGVRLELITPGVVDTDMPRNGWMRLVGPDRLAAVKARYPDGFPSADSVAAEIVALLDGGAS